MLQSAPIAGAVLRLQLTSAMGDSLLDRLLRLLTSTGEAVGVGEGRRLGGAAAVAAAVVIESWDSEAPPEPALTVMSGTKNMVLASPPKSRSEEDWGRRGSTVGSATPENMLAERNDAVAEGMARVCTGMLATEVIPPSAAADDDVIDVADDVRLVWMVSTDVEKEGEEVEATKEEIGGMGDIARELEGRMVGETDGTLPTGMSGIRSASTTITVSARGLSAGWMKVT